MSARPDDERRAAIVGVGGLGTPAAVALAASGIGLTLLDPDEVEASNLPRQPLFGGSDVGAAKARVAAARLRDAHPGLAVDAVVDRIDADNGPDLLRGHRVVIDATDGMAIKVLLNELALRLGFALIHAGVLGLEGQLMTILPGRSACLRCLFVELPDEDEIPGCQQSGILGPVVGAVGLAAAREARALLETGRAPLVDGLAILDGSSLRWRHLELRRNPRCPACG